MKKQIPDLKHGFFGGEFLQSEEDTTGAKQVQNYDGCWVYKISCFQRLERFLIIGSEGGSFYANEKDIAIESVKALSQCLEEDPNKTLDMIRTVSVQGLAPKNDPAVLSLALCAAYKPSFQVRKNALALLKEICRIPTDLFLFYHAVSKFRGQGRSLKSAMIDWYLSKPINKLAYLMIKYQNRNTWKHADVLRKIRPLPPDDDYRNLFGYFTKKVIFNDGHFYRAIVNTNEQGQMYWAVPEEGKEEVLNLPPIIKGKAQVQEAFRIAEEDNLISKDSDIEEIVELINLTLNCIADYKLTWEMLPTRALNSRKVWEALIPNTPPMALIRNLNKLTACGVFENKELLAHVATVISDAEYLKKSRVHPIKLLIAYKTYSSGESDKGSLSWFPNKTICDALQVGFLKSFSLLRKVDKRVLIAVDVSGSMSCVHSTMLGNVLAYEAAACIALALANSMDKYDVFGFDHRFKKLPVDPSMRFEKVLELMQSDTFGTTDCALPIEYALKNNLEIDTFIVITDNETNARDSRQVVTALRDYRAKSKIDAKLAVLATANSFYSIADPNDHGMIDIIGFSANVPDILTAFIEL